MEQIEQEQLKLLARKAQLMEELKGIDQALSNLAAFAQGFKSATPKQPKEEPAEE